MESKRINRQVVAISKREKDYSNIFKPPEMESIGIAVGYPILEHPPQGIMP
jgi:hypothetical protein